MASLYENRFVTRLDILIKSIKAYVDDISNGGNSYSLDEMYPTIQEASSINNYRVILEFLNGLDKCLCTEEFIFEMERICCLFDCSKKYNFCLRRASFLYKKTLVKAHASSPVLNSFLIDQVKQIFSFFKDSHGEKFEEITEEISKKFATRNIHPDPEALMDKALRCNEMIVNASHEEMKKFTFIDIYTIYANLFREDMWCFYHVYFKAIDSAKNNSEKKSIFDRLFKPVMTSCFAMQYSE